MALRSTIFAEIEKERARQQLQWTRYHSWGYGDCSSSEVEDIVKAAVLTEECGEVARTVLEGKRKCLRKELVQVAAVAVAWLESKGV